LSGDLDSGTEPWVSVYQIGRALAHAPQHPEYLAFAGHLKELQAGQPGIVGKTRREYLEDALRYYRAALTVRPLWPRDWAGLLRVKDGLGEVDGEFRHALRRSMETGPWTPPVQLQVVRSGLRHWDRLDSGEKVQIEALIHATLVNRPLELFEIIRVFGRPDLVCDVATGRPQIDRWCGRG
jgi:hypothetical protein